MKRFTDYDGPQGAYVATGDRIVPLDSGEGVAALAMSAMLTSLGLTKEAKEYEVKMKAALKKARALDEDLRDRS